MKNDNKLVNQLLSDRQDYVLKRSQNFEEVTARSAVAALKICQLERRIEELTGEQPNSLNEYTPSAPRPMKLANAGGTGPGRQATVNASDGLMAADLMKDANDIAGEIFSTLAEAEKVNRKIEKCLNGSRLFSSCLINKISSLEKENENQKRLLAEFIGENNTFDKRMNETWIDRAKRFIKEKIYGR